MKKQFALTTGALLLFGLALSPPAVAGHHSSEAVGKADTSDNKVTAKEARATVTGETRHHIIERVGPVDHYTVRLRDHQRVIDYRTYRPRYMWEVHYTRTWPLRYRWSALVHCPEACVIGP